MEVRSPSPFGLGRNGCWTSRGSRELSFIFSLCCSLNDRRKAAHSFHKIGRLFSFSLFSCSFLACLRLLILLLLLISGNVHPNPGPIFPCSVCGGNVTWPDKSVQCCTCFKWVHLRCSQPSLSKFRTLDSSHSWGCPHAVSPLVTLRLSTRTPPTCIPPLYKPALCVLMLHSRPNLVFKLLIPRRPIAYILPCPLTTLPCSWMSFYTFCLLSP